MERQLAEQFLVTGLVGEKHMAFLDRQGFVLDPAWKDDPPHCCGLAGILNTFRRGYHVRDRSLPGVGYRRAEFGIVRKVADNLDGFIL